MNDSEPADNLAHHRIEGQPLSIVDILVAGEPPEDRLTRKGDDAMYLVVTGARVLEVLAR